jgi:hypothetical protein
MYCWFGMYACMLIYVHFSFAMIESIVDEFEEEEYFEDFQEN